MTRPDHLARAADRQQRADEQSAALDALVGGAHRDPAGSHRGYLAATAALDRIRQDRKEHRDR